MTRRLRFTAIALLSIAAIAFAFSVHALVDEMKGRRS